MTNSFRNTCSLRSLSGSRSRTLSPLPIVSAVNLSTVVSPLQAFQYVMSPIYRIYTRTRIILVAPNVRSRSCLLFTPLDLRLRLPVLAFSLLYLSIPSTIRTNIYNLALPFYTALGNIHDIAFTARNQRHIAKYSGQRSRYINEEHGRSIMYVGVVLRTPVQQPSPCATTLLYDSDLTAAAW
jgi:hypothetical protein